MLVRLIYKLMLMTLQTHHMYFTLKRRGNGRFHVDLTWNTRGVFVGEEESLIKTYFGILNNKIFLLIALLW